MCVYRYFGVFMRSLHGHTAAGCSLIRPLHVVSLGCNVHPCCRITDLHVKPSLEQYITYFIHCSKDNFWKHKRWLTQYMSRGKEIQVIETVKEAWYFSVEKKHLLRQSTCRHT